ncbi:Embryo sac development arrest 6 [Heracleum sosnowskyi]|uniref:Embryo sac development arrest 6 n=1 Tax=Heracleum sosnowskyi TaxID=360622 RepID=A0AAD8GZ11_9APIA|nr:Embryo sac development arrest 6 [Heracleum sosnowskyi]
MNTSTMMNQHHRGVAPNKRKDREYQKPSKFIKPSQHQRATANAVTNNKQQSSAANNKVLAGYMAYEFLSKGTLLGQELAKPIKMKRHEKYVEIVGVLKRDGGVQIPGVVNPTQLNPFSQL